MLVDDKPQRKERKPMIEMKERFTGVFEKGNSICMYETGGEMRKRDSMVLDAR